MKITVLDGYTLNPGDLSWEALGKLGDLEVFPRSTPEEAIERAKDSEILLINKIVMTSEVLEKLPKLKYIGVLAAGYNVVDVEAAKRMGIAVTNTPNYGSEEVAQMVFAHILEITNNVALHSKSVKNGEWGSSADFCYWKKTVISLKDKTLGLIGYGNIGKIVKNIGESFGMKVIVNAQSHKDGVENVSLDELLSRSNIISLHCPLTKETNNLIGKKEVQLMKNGTILINSSRGGLVETEALEYGIKSGKIYGYGTDVLPQEPPSNLDEIFTTESVNITPHIAWAALESRERLLNIAVNNVKSFLENGEENRIV